MTDTSLPINEKMLELLDQKYDLQGKNTNPRW